MKNRPLLLLATCALASFGASQTPKHVFGVSDWVALRSVSSHAVLPEGTWILYTVSGGADKGPSVTEWRVIHPDGQGERKIELPKGFGPAGFLAGERLYGTFKVDGKPALAIFALDGLK